MALTTPILANKAAFDATEETEEIKFSFEVIGGDTYDYVYLRVTNQSTGEYTDYSNETSGNIFVLPVPNNLTNGTYYTANIRTQRTSSPAGYSNWSNAIQFYCYSTPTFEFTNIVNNQVINSSTYSFGLTYSQAQGDLLSNYIINIYNVQGSLIKTSGTIYLSGATTFPVYWNCDIFADNTFYKIQAQGKTAGGTFIETDLITFSASYSAPSAFSSFELTNNCEGGYIYIQSHFTSLVGISNPSPPIYVKNDSAVDLTNSGSYVNWNEDYKFSENFTMQIWGYEFNLNSTIILLKDSSENSVEIKYLIDEDDDTKVYVSALFISGKQTYFIYSSSITAPISSDKVQIWLRKVNGLSTIEIYNLGS